MNTHAIGFLLAFALVPAGAAQSLAPAMAAAPRGTFALVRGGFGGGGFALPNDFSPTRTPPYQGGGFDLGNDGVAYRNPPTAGSNSLVRQRNNTNNNNSISNTNTSTIQNNVNTGTSNRNYVRNEYGYRGRIVANPVYQGPAWGWDHGVVWAAGPAYWGGGFWGAFAPGAATAVAMGTIGNAANHQTYTSYAVSEGSPGAQLLSDYRLQQVSCGPPNLVVLYGPNNGVVCANPNDLVSAGTYAVNVDTLTLQAP